MLTRNSSISNFKRFSLKFLLPFLLLFFGGGYLFQYFFERKVVLNSEMSGAYKINRIIAEVHSKEMPLFGSSRMETSLIPEVLGTGYFNYGLSGIQDDVILFLLAEECKKNKTTPILINFDLDGLDHDLGNRSGYLYNINYKPVRQLLGKADAPYYHIPVLKYFGYYEEYLRILLSEKIAFTKYTNRGAIVEKQALTPAKFAELVKQRKMTPERFVNDPILLKHLAAIINAHPEREFIFVIAPYHPSYFSAFVNEQDADRFLQYLDAFKNARVLNFSKATYPDSFFYNTSHLNYRGARQYSASIKEAMRKLGY